MYEMGDLMQNYFCSCIRKRHNQFLQVKLHFCIVFPCTKLPGGNLLTDLQLSHKHDSTQRTNTKEEATKAKSEYESDNIEIFGCISLQYIQIVIGKHIRAVVDNKSLSLTFCRLFIILFRELQ